MTVKEANALVKAKSIFSQKLLIEDLLSDEFISANTDSEDFEKFFSKCNVGFSNQEEFENLDVSLLDNFISDNTKFKTWVSFLQAAVGFRQ